VAHFRELQTGSRLFEGVSVNIQWLLIGGTCDGKAVWIKQGSRVLCGGTLYEGQNYLHNGKLYRIGVLDPNAPAPSQVGNLIDNLKLAHIAGD
jgi:hypothetical protein